MKDDKDKVIDVHWSFYSTNILTLEQLPLCAANGFKQHSVDALVKGLQEMKDAGTLQEEYAQKRSEVKALLEDFFDRAIGKAEVGVRLRMTIDG
jgi:hypothetical protein